MGDLAARLKSRGLELPSEAPVLGGGAGLSLSAVSFPSSVRTSGGGGRGKHASVGAVTAASAAVAAAPVHAALGTSKEEYKQLFTPLANQGAKALEEENKRKKAGEQDLLKEVKATLKRWVQECLAREDKSKRLKEKGILKCRVHAKWSEGLHEKLKELIASYKGRLVADCEKENSADGKPPAWLPRQEKWLVGFDSVAFEAFMELHPEVIEPPPSKVRLLVEEFVSRDTGKLDQHRLRELKEALEARFGTLRPLLLEHVASIAEEAIMARLHPKRGVKRKEGTDREGQQQQGKKPRPGAPRIEKARDAAWAAAVLAPLGLRGDGTPIVKVPASLACLFLDGLLNLEQVPDFHQALKSTSLGKVVNNYRHHKNQEVAAAARDLVSAWKAALSSRGAAK